MAWCFGPVKYQREEPIEGSTPTFLLRDVPLAGHFITFSLCLSLGRIDTPPLQPEALAFVSYGFILVRVRVRVKCRCRFRSCLAGTPLPFLQSLSCRLQDVSVSTGAECDQLQFLPLVMNFGTLKMRQPIRRPQSPWLRPRLTKNCRVMARRKPHISNNEQRPALAPNSKSYHYLTNTNPYDINSRGFGVKWGV